MPRLPDSLRLVVTTRSDPPIGLARLRARGDLAELRADDLRFTSAEAARLLGDAIGARPAGDEVARLRPRTEGWAAGLYLAGLSLRGRDDAAAFIADFAGDDRLVVDYLAARGAGGAAARAARLPAAHVDARSPQRRRSATPSPGRERLGRGARPSSSARTCSSCPSTTAASGTATTTSSASCCATSSA